MSSRRVSTVSLERSGQTVCHILPLGRRVAYSVGHILNDLCACMWFTYLLIFQQSVLQFDTKIAGKLLLIGQVADAISTPLVGLESDRSDNCRCCKYGQRKTWHLIGTVCVIATFPFLFMTCIECSHSSQTAQFAYFAAFIVIFQFGWASTQVSHLSLIPDLTPLSTERVELNALRYAMTVMSNVCVYGTTWLVLGVNSSEESRIGPKDASVFKYVALLMVGIGSFFSLMFHIFVKEKPSIIRIPVSDELLINEDSIEEEDEKPHLRWKDWFLQPQFYMVALLYMATRLYINISQIYMPLYIEKTLNLHKNNIAIIPLVIYVTSFLTSFLVKYLNLNLGAKITYFMGCVVAISACIWMYVGQGQSYNLIQIYVVGVLIGIAGSTLLIISLSFTSDLISNSVTSGAFVFGCMSFVDKLANGIVIVVIQSFHPCIQSTIACGNYYKSVLVFGCGGAIMLGLCALGMLTTQIIGVRRNEDKIPGLPSQRTSRASSRATLRDVGIEDDDKPLLITDDSEAEYDDDIKILSDEKVY